MAEPLRTLPRRVRPCSHPSWRTSAGEERTVPYKFQAQRGPRVSTPAIGFLKFADLGFIDPLLRAHVVRGRS